MIERVYARAKESGASRVVVATDNRKIIEEVRGFGGDAMMTSQDHLSGTDRVCEAAVVLGLREEDIIVNVQGDEPLIPASSIKQVASEISQENEIVTLCERITSVEDFLNSNIVKVVRDQKNQALIFPERRYLRILGSMAAAQLTRSLLSGSDILVFTPILSDSLKIMLNLTPAS